VRIDARAAPYIQYRRPHIWTDRATHWYKHSLGQWAAVMVVGGHECALMRALRARTCVQHHISRIGGKRLGRSGPKLVQTLIGTMGRRYGDGRSRVRIYERAAPHVQHMSARSAQSGRHSRPARARSTRTSTKRESTGMEQGGTSPARAKQECGARTVRVAHIARVARGKTICVI
jgi:hypothetical protein